MARYDPSPHSCGVCSPLEGNSDAACCPLGEAIPVDGTPGRLDGEKHVKFNVFGITENGQMDFRNGDSKYATEKSKKPALATPALIAAVGLGFGYATGDTRPRQSPG